MPKQQLPEVTEAHRQEAFEAMAWADWTYEQAMADDTRSRIVEARAHLLRTRECQAKTAPYVAGLQTALRNARYVSRVDLQRQGPRNQPRPPTTVDLKRAAAGDRDDD